MLTSTHSPGPWELHRPIKYAANSLRLFSGDRYIATIGHSDDTESQLMANAALIAAAPELLEVCEKWAELIQIGGQQEAIRGWSRECVAELRAVIEKAKRVTVC